MAEATCGTCLACASRVGGDRLINDIASIGCQCRQLKIIVLGRLQYLPVTFCAVNRGWGPFGQTEPQRMVADRRYRYGDPNHRLRFAGGILSGSGLTAKGC